MDAERRSLLKGLAAGLTGAVVGPSSSEAEPLPPSASDPGLQATASPQAPPVPPGLLDPHQRATLASLAELILPGSVAAGTIDRIDRVAAADAPAAQRRLLNAIARFDLEARAASAGRWIDLSETARLEILTRAAEGAPGQEPRPAWTRGQAIPPVPLSAPAAATTLRDHLDMLKATIGPAFASTEEGMKALGWAGRSSWRELPGCSGADAAYE
jgi:Gluconate 2-dehydrogenase subunit 3